MMQQPIKVKEQGNPQFRLTLDWQAYFHEFCRVHGEPILWKGRMLFRDGWQYSATDYQGPEFPPPDNPEEITRLVVIYYKHRLAILSKIRRGVADLVEWLINLQSHKSVPLQQKVASLFEKTDYLGNKSVYKKYMKEEVRVKEYTERLKWLDRDIGECLQKIQENENASKTTQASH